ncbi:MAG TPA: lysozyme inhibitor LprI family protein [Dyella sp.]|nr:lysozyme inhibitor LprI family protein [Dyella sp.]
MKKTIIVLSAMLMPYLAHAYGCEKPRNAYDLLYCKALVLVQADRDLNQEYSHLLTQLNAAQKETLKKGQLAWIAERDEQCSVDTGDNRSMRPQCALDMMHTRITFLQERERECGSTGCVEAKLGG